MVEAEYAKAIYELALEENKVNKILDCFNAIIKTMKDDFMNIMASPYIHKSEKKDIVAKVYKSLDTTFINFLYVLIDHNRFIKLKEIFEKYNEIFLENKNIVRIQVVSVKELTKNQIKNLEDSLKQKYVNKKLELENIVDPNIIGGIQILSNDESVDLSLKTALIKIKESL